MVKVGGGVSAPQIRWKLGRWLHQETGGSHWDFSEPRGKKLKGGPVRGAEDR